MENKLINVVIAGLAIAGLVTAAKAFSKELDRVDRNGFSAASLISLGLAGGILLYRFDSAASKVRRLSA